MTAILSFVILPTIAEAKYRGGGGSRGFKSRSYKPSPVKRVAPTKKVAPKKASKRTEPVKTQPVKKKVTKPAAVKKVTPAPVKKKVEPKKPAKKTTVVHQNNTVINRTENSGGGFISNIGSTMAGMWLFGAFFGGNSNEAHAEQPPQEVQEQTEPPVQQEVKEVPTL